MNRRSPDADARVEAPATFAKRVECERFSVLPVPPEAVGAEIQKTRPAVVMHVPEVGRLPLCTVVPVTE